MLENEFVPHLLATILPWNTQWFMQDGATPHTVNAVLDFLHETFANRVVSPLPTAPSRGILLASFKSRFKPLWGYLKKKTLPIQTTESYGNACSHCAVVQRDK